MVSVMCRWTDLLCRAGRGFLLLALCVMCTSYIVLHFLPSGVNSSYPPFDQKSPLHSLPIVKLKDSGANEQFRSEVATLSAQNEDLRSQLTRLQEQVAAMQLTQSLGTAEALDEETGDVQRQAHIDAEEARLAAYSDDNQYDFALLEEQFYAESPDAQWAATMQRDFHSIEARLNEHTGGGTRIEYQECRSSTCRVEYTHEHTAPTILPALIASPNNTKVILQSVTQEGLAKTIALYRR